MEQNWNYLERVRGGAVLRSRREYTDVEVARTHPKGGAQEVAFRVITISMVVKQHQ